MKIWAKWSIDDYHQMVEAGILHSRNVELLGGESEPEPDIAIVRLPESSYSDRHPAPQDIF